MFVYVYLVPTTTPAWPFRPLPPTPAHCSQSITPATRLDLAVTLLCGEPCKAGFEGSTAGVVVCECGVNAEGVADSEGVSNEDRDGAVKGCEEGDEVRLDLGKDDRGSSKGCFRDP